MLAYPLTPDIKYTTELRPVHQTESVIQNYKITEISCDNIKTEEEVLNYIHSKFE
jgi:hypothetical protein